MEPNGVLKKCVFCVSLVFGYCVALFYGLVCIYDIFRSWLKYPSDDFWQVKHRELPPACLNDATLGNHAYVQIKNVKLHYVEKGDKSKPLMLCLHGFPEFWYSWRNQLKEFSSDYWVVAVDMRGYGDSEKPIGKDKYKMDFLVADVKNLIIALGREKCTLVAHDWGGIIAWFFVLLHPQMVDSYVIMNSAHPVAFLRVLNSSISQFLKSWYVFFFQLPCLPELMLRVKDLSSLPNLQQEVTQGTESQKVTDDQHIEAFKFTFGKTGALTCPINYYRANFMLEDRHQLEARSRSPDLPPGLILFGENDTYLDHAIQEETKRLVNNLTLVYVKNSNHFVQQHAPTEVNREMREFFDQIKSKQN